MKFIYGDDGSTSLDLSRLEAEGNEMIYVVSAGYVDKLILPAFANEIKIGSKVYNYVSGGNAYFTLGGNTVTDFALADEGDSITVGKNQEINVFDDEDPYGNLINVYSGANYTVTKTKYNYTAALTESADIRIGETNLYFEISKATKETLANNPIVITFENDGTIVSVEGLYNLTSTDDKLFVSGEYVTNEYGGLPVISRNGKLEYISVSDGYFTFTGGTEGNQTVEVSQGATVHSLCENLKLIVDKLISNGNDNILVSGTSEDDIISNYGSKVTIKADAGNDNIYNDYEGSSVTIDAGEGDDDIENLGGSIVSISGGKGNDTISTDNYETDYYETDDDGYPVLRHETYEAKNNTINGGAGDDLIKLGEKVPNNVIEYKSGDGNDTIEGFNEDDTLKIGGGKGTYSSLANADDDIIIEVGEEKITLKGAAKLDNVNIDGEYVNPRLIVGTEGNDNIENTLEGATIQALGGKDSVTNSGNNVSIDGGKGADYIYTEGNGGVIIAGAGNDSISLITDAAYNLIQYKSGEGNDTITGLNEDDTLSISGSYSTQKSGADILVKVGKGTITLKDVYVTTETININGETIELEKNITLTDGNDYIDNYRNNVTINALGGDDTIANSVDEVTIDGGEGNDSIENYCGDSVSIDGGAGNDTISLGYLTYGNLIKYTEGDGNDLIQSFGEYDTLKIAGSSYSTKKSGEDIIVTVGEGKITLEGAAYWDTLNIVSDKPSWTLDGTTATYGTSDNTLVTVKGVKSLDGLSLNGKVVTVDKSALGTDKVTISDGYTLALGSDVTKSSISKTAWSHKGTTATYNQTTTAGYTLADDGKSVSYSDAMTTALATVKGAKSAKGLSVSDKKITLKKSALSKKVTVSGDYEFDFASDYKQALITGSTNSDTIIARGSKITINGGAGDDLFVGNASKDSLNGSDGNDKLYGNAGNDKIYGGNGNDTLRGDAGNDLLTGGAGADKFIYAKGDGKDVIFDFANDDLLQITGTFTGTYNKSKDEAYFKVGSTSSAITLKNFTATTFNINDDTYQISGTKFVKK